MHYDLSVKAEEDLVRLYLDGVQRFGVHAAEEYWAQFERFFQLPAENPAAAKARAEIDPPVRIHPCGAHVIVYIAKDEGGILVLRVRHGREDWSNSPV